MTDSNPIDSAKRVEPKKYILELIAQEDFKGVQEYTKKLEAGEMARALAAMNEEEHSLVLNAITPTDAAQIIDEVPVAQAAALIHKLPAEKAASIVDEMNSDDQVDLLNTMSTSKSEAILQQLEPEVAETARTLMQYEGDVAGGLMISEYLTFQDDVTAGELVTQLRKNGESYAHYEVQYVYLVNTSGQLTGTIQLRNLFFSSESSSVKDIMIKNPKSIRDDTPLNKINHFFDEFSFLAAPVVDAENRIVGIVRKDAVEEAIEQRTNKMLLRLSGIVTGEELRSMPFMGRSSRRLSWLSLNIVLNIVAASVIALFENTLQQVIALAVFLPMISDMSGCSGNQSVAVSCRELAIGVAKPKDVFRVLKKEIPIGLFNGLVLGLVIGFVALIWKGNPYIGLIVGAAMWVNTLISVSIGSSVPLIARGFGFDPALVSSPMLTTVTDMCGFFFVLGLATIMLPYLV